MKLYRMKQKSCGKKSILHGKSRGIQIYLFRKKRLKRNTDQNKGIHFHNFFVSNVPKKVQNSAILEQFTGIKNEL